MSTSAHPTAAILGCTLRSASVSESRTRRRQPSEATGRSCQMMGPPESAKRYGIISSQTPRSRDPGCPPQAESSGIVAVDEEHRQSRRLNCRRHHGSVGACRDNMKSSLRYNEDRHEHAPGLAHVAWATWTEVVIRGIAERTYSKQ